MVKSRQGVSKVEMEGVSMKAGVVRDARMKIISKKRSRMGDAREKLVSLTKQGGDARKRLEKIRNLKSGKLDVKTTSKGGITITKTTGGKTLLTTKKRSGQDQKKKKAEPKSSLIKSVGRGGTISLRTKPKTSTLTGVAKSRAKTTRAAQGSRSGRSSGAGEKITRTIRGELSEAAKLDLELINTKVDPVILKRTVNQDTRGGYRRRSPLRSSGYNRHSPEPPYTRYRQRSRSPIDVDAYDRPMRRYNDYDDPHRQMARENSYRSRIHSAPIQQAPTLADRFGGMGGSGISPLEGAKIIVSNLNHSVSREDIIELFGDVGALKRAKISTPGTAEVVFVNRDDAMKAVEIYHNRQLDQKAMICKMVGSGGLDTTDFRSALKLPKDTGRRSDNRGPGGMPVEMNSIHKALFSDRPGRRSDRGRRY